MLWKIEDGKLYVRHSKRYIRFFGIKFRSNNKDLTFCLPEGYRLDDLTVSSASADLSIGNTDIKELNINIASGGVSLNDLTIEEFRANGASSMISVTDADIKKTRISIASGNVTLAGKFESIRVDGASGKVEINPEVCPLDIDVNTASGSFTLNLPADTEGFTAKVSMASGSVNMPSGTENTGKNKYVYKNGSAEFDFRSASGSIKVNVSE